MLHTPRMSSVSVEDVQQANPTITKRTGLTTEQQKALFNKVVTQIQEIDDVNGMLGLLTCFRQWGLPDDLLTELERISPSKSATVGKIMELWISEFAHDFDGSGLWYRAVTLWKDSKKPNPTEFGQFMKTAKIKRQPFIVVEKRNLLLEMIINTPTEAAQHFTMVDADIFRKIERQEILKSAWTKDPGKLSLAPNIKTLSGRFNTTALWAATQIIEKFSGLDPKEGIRITEKFIELAYILIKYQNFHTGMTMFASFNVFAVARLKTNLWQKISERARAQYEELQPIFNPAANYRGLREAIKHAHSKNNEPLLPFIGIFLKDLVYADDGIDDLCADGSINISKMIKVGEIVRLILYYQNRASYNFKTDEVLEKYLDDLSSLSEDELNKRSYRIQPSKLMASLVNSRSEASRLSAVVKENDNSTEQSEDSELRIWKLYSKFQRICNEFSQKEAIPVLLPSASLVQAKRSLLGMNQKAVIPTIQRSTSTTLIKNSKKNYQKVHRKYINLTFPIRQADYDQIWYAGDIDARERHLRNIVKGVKLPSKPLQNHRSRAIAVQRGNSRPVSVKSESSPSSSVSSEFPRSASSSSTVSTPPSPLKKSVSQPLTPITKKREKKGFLKNILSKKQDTK